MRQPSRSEIQRWLQASSTWASLTSSLSAPEANRALHDLSAEIARQAGAERREVLPQRQRLASPSMRPGVRARVVYALAQTHDHGQSIEAISQLTGDPPGDVTDAVIVLRSTGLALEDTPGRWRLTGQGRALHHSAVESSGSPLETS